MLYDFLLDNFGRDEPIFLSELSYEGKSAAALRQIMSKLVADGQIRRFDQGIYYIPEKGLFRSGRALSCEKVIERKYLFDKSKARCGYISGQDFANEFGVTTQVPLITTVVSNKATTKERRFKLGGREILLRQPRCRIDAYNYRILQLLDLVTDVDRYREVTVEEAKKRMEKYMQQQPVRFMKMEQYFSYYPVKLFKNMYEMGILRGIPA
jgi:predicted transcriptional regulator of viral defense system